MNHELITGGVLGNGTWKR